MSIMVKRYSSCLASDWSKVLMNSRNGIFLFDRNFIEYHGNRFTDFSAVAYIDENPVALLPASIDLDLDHVSSHAGLTFGGVVLKRELRGDVAIELINALLDSLKEWGAKTLTVKLLPQVFACYPSAEIEYVLWRRGFSLVRRDLSSLLPLQNPLPFNATRMRAIKKARKAGLKIVTSSFVSFHALLENVLSLRHGVSPVHSLKDIELLASRFPERIFVRGAIKDGMLLAGALIFNFEHIWHTQYVAASDMGRSHGALDLVINSIIDEAKSQGVSHLSFGASTENDGAALNSGLIYQKESFGARSITHDFMSGVL
ncbi:MAG: GNAT family N-acetyltransferase [Chlorobiaceae bacterium]